jgi:DNA repair exonuclease SbcCD ATPase subunit
MSLNNLSSDAERKLLTLENEYREIEWKLSSQIGDIETLTARREELPNLIGEVKVEVAFKRVEWLHTTLEALKLNFDIINARTSELHTTYLERAKEMQAELEFIKNEEQEATWEKNILESKYNEMQRDLIRAEGELESLMSKYNYIHHVID